MEDIYRALLHDSRAAPEYCIRRRRAGHGEGGRCAGIGNGEGCEAATCRAGHHGEGEQCNGAGKGGGCEAAACRGGHGDDDWCHGNGDLSDPCEAAGPTAGHDDPCDGAGDPEGPTASSGHAQDGGKIGQRAGDGEGTVLGDMGAASDVFLVQRRTGGVAPSRLQTIRRVSYSYWMDAAKRWVWATVFGRQEPFLPSQWSWTSIMGPAVYQPHRRGKGDGSCVICACVVCIHAQHRLAFERRYGAGSFPYELSAVDYVKHVCLRTGIWQPWGEHGTDPQTVLAVLKDELPDGLRTNPVPGWLPCDLPFTSFFRINRADFDAQVVAGMIRELGPAVGTLRVNERYTTVIGPNDVYRGTPGLPNHAVVCVAYYIRPHNGEVWLRVLDNARQDGPFRWALFDAFTAFFFIQVDPLDRDALLRPNARRSLLQKILGIWK